MTYLPYAGIGSRDTPEHALKKMRSCAKRLKELGFTLRSGGAKGADSAFEQYAGTQAEIYLPFDGFEGKEDDGGVYINSIFLPKYTDAHNLAAKYHPKGCGLTPNQMLYHTRNVMQMLGASLDKPSLFVVCWTKDGKASGGTGQSLRIAKALDIPVFNLYFNDALERLGSWLKENGYV